MFNLILFGPPGSGKGTQSEKLIAKYHLKHLSTGDLLRNEISRKTPLGLEAKKNMDKGLQVPDAVVIGMIGDALDNNPGVAGILFDGFPRTAIQAEELDALLARKNTCIDVMLALDVSEDELIKRLVKRGETSGRADDSNEQVIKARIREYHKKTASVADHYKKENKVEMIKGEGTIDEIFQRLTDEIDRLMKIDNCD
jgi:adenylate kinase